MLRKHSSPAPRAARAVSAALLAVPLLVLSGLGQVALAQSPPPGSSAGPRNLRAPVARVTTVPIGANGQAAPTGIRTTMDFSSVSGDPIRRGTMVTGTGTGFNMLLNGRYFSLVYDLQSVSPQDSGARPPFCRKNNDTIPFTSMIIGSWVVTDPLIGAARLVQLPTNLTQTQGFPLALARTASVRFDSQAGNAASLPEPDPTRFLLQSCGTLFTP